jgi:alpha-amylase/alpha-mannosidase (GH57 family)
MQKQNRFLCIHAHFYQPPRENPWLEEIEVQDSAYPYHDWNERVTAECYATNLTARIQDSSNQITRIVNNYAQISFNFGPTLLSWAKVHAPDVYEGVLEADRLSAKRFSGHGSAISQAYNHMILPLANRRDKETQVKWGIADFESRFSRRPEAMWLPETAVDLETLEVLAAEGVSYTIRRSMDRRQWRKDRSQPRLCVPAAFRPEDQSVLLRRPRFAGGRVRAITEQWRKVRGAADRRIFRRANVAAIDAYRDRR